MKNLTLLPFLLLSCATLAAQGELVGRVIDSTGTTLPGANLVLLQRADSVMAANATTDAQGIFRMVDVAPGAYLLRVTFLGYERPDKNITVTASDQYLDYGDLTMYPAGFLLDGVEVTADRIAVRMRGDTMLYDAGAFAVGQNAAVEDLIRRLPGMAVDGAGNITFRGRPINEVMINGKPFFAGNSTLLTQNLDAEAIANIEVYDQKSDAEEVTGIDDGEENMTVNLKMKEQYKAKVFGELYGGYGTQDRYQAGGKTFRISDASQLGLLGTINNVNRIGFSGDEISGFNGSTGRGRGRWWEGGGQARLSYNRGSRGDRRGGADGRTFGANAYGNFSENQTDLDLLTDGIAPGLDLPGVLVNGEQVQDRRTSTQNFGAGAEFAEPLADNWRLNLEGEVDYDNEQGDFTFRLAERTETNLLERTWQSTRGGASLVHSFGERNNVSVGTWYQRSSLILQGDENQNETFGYVLPFVRLRIRSEKGNFGANLRSAPEAPSMTQLQTIANPNASGRVSVGNPDLRPSMSYRYNSWLWWNDEFKAIGFNGSFDWGVYGQCLRQRSHLCRGAADLPHDQRKSRLAASGQPGDYHRPEIHGRGAAPRGQWLRQSRNGHRGWGSAP